MMIICAGRLIGELLVREVRVLESNELERTLVATVVEPTTNNLRLRPAGLR